MDTGEICFFGGIWKNVVAVILQRSSGLLAPSSKPSNMEVEEASSTSLPLHHRFKLLTGHGLLLQKEVHNLVQLVAVTVRICLQWS